MESQDIRRAKALQKNRARQAGINITSYKAMFGVDPRVGSTTTNLPDDVINTINVEDDFKNFTDTQTRREDKYKQEAAGILFPFFTPTK